MKNILKKLFISLLLLLSFSLLVIACLPFALSQQPIQNYLLRICSNRIPGHVQVQSASFGWISGIQIENLQIEDANQRFSVHADHISFDHPLYRLIPFNSHETMKARIVNGSLTMRNAHNTITLTDLNVEAEIERYKNAHLSIDCIANSNEKKGYIHTTLQLVDCQHIVNTYDNLFFGSNKTRTDSVVASCDVRIEKLPLDLVDQLVALKYPELQGLISALVGPELTAHVKHDLKNNTAYTIAKIDSKNMTCDFDLFLDATSLQVPQGMSFAYTLETKAVNKLLQVYQLPYALKENSTLKANAKPLVANSPFLCTIEQSKPAIIANQKGQALAVDLSAVLSGESLSQGISSDLQCRFTSGASVTTCKTIASIKNNDALLFDAAATIDGPTLELASFFQCQNIATLLHDLIGNRLALSILSTPLPNGEKKLSITMQSPKIQLKMPESILTMEPELALTMKEKAIIDFTCDKNIVAPYIHANSDIPFEICAELSQPLFIKKIQETFVLKGVLSSKDIALCGLDNTLVDTYHLTNDFSVNLKKSQIDIQLALVSSLREKISAQIVIHLPSVDNPFGCITQGAWSNVSIDQLRRYIPNQPWHDFLGKSIHGTWDISWEGFQQSKNRMYVDAVSENMSAQVQLVGGAILTETGSKPALLCSVKVPKDIIKQHAQASTVDHDLELAISVSKCSLPVKKMVTHAAIGAILDEATFDLQATSKPMHVSFQKSANLAIPSLDIQSCLKKGSRNISVSVQSKKDTYHKPGITSPEINIQGSFRDLWNLEAVNIAESMLEFDAKVHDFPLSFLSSLMTTKENAKKITALLGPTLDTDFSTKIDRLETGTLSAKISSENLVAQLVGKIQNSNFTLNEPVTATLSFTEKSGHAMFKDSGSKGIKLLYAKKPIQLCIDKNGVSVPLKNFSVSQIKIPNAKIDIGELQVQNSGLIRSVIDFLKSKASSKNEAIHVWCTPLYFSLSNGVLNCKRFDALIANSFPVASWGTIHLSSKKLDMVAALHGVALKHAFRIKHLDPDYMLQMAITGSFSEPKLDTKRATAKLAALTMKDAKSDKAALIGGLLGAAATISEKDSPVPPPTTSPFPWKEVGQPKNKK